MKNGTIQTTNTAEIKPGDQIMTASGDLIEVSINTAGEYTIDDKDFDLNAEEKSYLNQRVKELGEKLKTALTADRPVLIEIPVPLLDAPWVSGL